MAMILLTGSYNEPDPGRRAELCECLRRNLDKKQIQEVHLFDEDTSEPRELMADGYLNLDKVRLIPHGRRLTYRDLFGYANQCLAGCAVIIANADIFFDRSLSHLDSYDLSGKLLCLSRWDVQPDGSLQLFE